MPSVSDPGYRLVVAAVAAGLEVTVLPGPSAVTAALAVSGLPTDRFCFEGFPPRKAGERARAFAALAADPRTSVTSSPPGARRHPPAMAAAFGDDRPAAVCRELTKTYEEVRRGSLAELAAWAAAGEPRGEICIVVGGRTGAAAVPDDVDLLALVAGRMADGASRRDAAAAVAAELGLRRRDVYERALHAPVRAARRRGEPAAGLGSVRTWRRGGRSSPARCSPRCARGCPPAPVRRGGGWSSARRAMRPALGERRPRVARPPGRG